MTSLNNAYHGNGFPAGYRPPSGESRSLPGIREMVPEIDHVPSRPPWSAARTPSWPTSPMPCSPGARATPPYQYAHSASHQPLESPWTEDERTRVGGWQPELGHSVPRRLPTPLSPACPPRPAPSLASWAPEYDEADPYRSQRRYSQGAHGYGGPRESSHGGYHGGYHAWVGSYGKAEGQAHDHRSAKRGSVATDGEPEERRKRRNFSADTTETLKKWVETRIDNPHFDPKEVAETAKKTGKTRKQIEDWLINYRRRGWHKRKFEIYSTRLRDAQAEYRDALHRARDAAATGDEAARRAAEAHVALVDAKVQQAVLKEQKARREWQEHENKKGGPSSSTSSSSSGVGAGEGPGGKEGGEK